LAADPTLDLLGVLFVELAAVWAGYASFRRAGAADPHPRFGPVYTGVVVGVAALTLAAVAYTAAYAII
jgi:hypothetical protein